MPNKYDRCVAKLKKQKSVNPYAVCTTSIYGKRRKK